METGIAGSWHHGIKTPYKEKTMQPHQERVVDERDELVEKLTKLNSFMTGEIYNGLPSDEKVRLARQACAMKDYLDILNERIQAF
jgi:hypothetical protein